MNNELDPSQQLATIRKMMERSSRFISLSGLSGISAGICALVGALIAHPYIYGNKEVFVNPEVGMILAMEENYLIILNTWLFWIALATFVVAFFSAFLFTWTKSKKQGIPLWGRTSKRLLFHIAIPMLAGGLFLFKMLQFGAYGLFAPGCLIFYGLSLVNASRYTLQEIKYLGYAQVLLGLINLLFIGCGLYFWAAGFGILHIIYGFYMWNKYDRNQGEELNREA